MANKDWDTKQNAGQTGPSNTSGAQDPTKGYGLEKEPMDSLKPTRDRMAYQGATERAEDRQPRTELDGSKSVPRSGQQTDQRVHGQSSEGQLRQDQRSSSGVQGSQVSPRTGNQGDLGQQRAGNQGQSSSQRIGGQTPSPTIGSRHNQSSQRLGGQSNQGSVGQRHDGSGGSSSARGQAPPPPRKDDFRK